MTEKKQIQLTTGSEREASWSPDGSKIVFVADNAGGRGLALFTMQANGSNRMRLIPE